MALKRTLAQGLWELRQLMRNGEQLLISFVFPIVALVVMSRTAIVSTSAPSDALAGALAMAVLSSAFSSQAISLSIDRRYGVLRMFGTTALGPQGLLAGKALAVAAVVTLQTGVLAALAAGLGIHSNNWPIAVLYLLLGVVVNVSLAVLLGGTLRAETVIPVANLLWVLMLAAGALAPVPALAWLPPALLGDGLRLALLAPTPASLDVAPLGLVALAAWGAALAFAARRALKWD